MDRVLVDTVATTGITFYLDGVSTPPADETAVVTVTRADGTEIVSDADTSRVGSTGGEFVYTLGADVLGDMDVLRLDWQATFDVGGEQTLTTYVEVVGGYLFSLADARKDRTLQDEDKYPLEAVLEARTMAEQAIEKACGVAFVPRYSRETVSGYGDQWIDGLRWPAVRNFRTVSVDGTEFTSDQLAKVTAPGPWVHYDDNWTAGFRNVVIGYEHGYDGPPGEVSRACLRLAKHYLVDSPQDDRALRIDTESGSMVISAPGMRGQRFGIPEVDAVVQAYQYAQPMVA